MKLTSQRKQIFLSDLQRNLQDRRWNISRLAKEAQIHQSQVSRIAAGKFKTFGSNIITICMILEMDPAAYYAGTRAHEDRQQIANTAISIWDGTHRDVTVVVALLREIAKLRKRNAKR